MDNDKETLNVLKALQGILKELKDELGIIEEGMDKHGQADG